MRGSRPPKPATSLARTRRSDRPPGPESDWAEIRPWLVGHLDSCGRAGGATDVHVEHDVTVFDTDANLVFSTRLDLA